MKIQRSRGIRFNVTYDDGSHQVIEFIPVDNVPGWTHRIAIDGKLTKNWLSNTHKPSVETAAFFLRKEQEEQAQRNAPAPGALPSNHWCNRPACDVPE